MKNFTLFLSNLNNALLTKDVGVIPFIMQKHYGYKSRIITLKQEEDITYNKKYLENLDVDLINDNKNIENIFKNTDVLMLIGFYDFNIDALNLYKKLNPNGKVYLKLDANLFWMCSLNKQIDNKKLNFLKSCDLISVESRRLQSLLSSLWNVDIKFIPNGYYNFTGEKDEIVDYEKKDNTILFTGRVGAVEKNNIMLLEAFKIIEDKIKDWKIELAGPVDDNFLFYISNYFKENPNLKNRVVLSGNHHKKELNKIYKQSKIFCLTSYSEACANVFSEAIHNGCYLICTDVDGAIDIIDYGKYGSIVPINNIDRLSVALLEICTNDNLLKNTCETSQVYSRENLDWIKLCEDIRNLIS